MGQKNPASAVKLKAIELEIQALELRKAGATFRQIGAKLGCSGRGAHKAVMRALSKLIAERDRFTEELRELELQRIDQATLALARQVQSGNLGAVDRWIKLSETRRKLLGLDMPAKLQITEGDLDAAIQAELAAMASTEQIGASGSAEEEE